MKLKDDWYNGQGKFDLAKFIGAEYDNFRWNCTTYDSDTGERMLRIRGADIHESGKLCIHKNTDGTIAENGQVPHDIFGVTMHSVSKVTPVLMLRDPLTSVETRTSMFATTHMRGLLIYDADVAKLYNVPKHWNDSYWDLNDDAKFVKVEESHSWNQPNGFYYISETSRPHLNKFWQLISKSYRTIEQLNVTGLKTHGMTLNSAGSILEGKNLEQLAQLTEEDILADMMDRDNGVCYYLARQGKKHFISYAATKSDTPYMEVI